jgi:adenylate cyclase
MKKYTAAAIFLLGSLAFVALLSKYTSYFTILELKTYDLMMTVMRGPLKTPDDIAIVGIDEASIQEFSDRFSYPWPRSIHGELIRLLNEAGAKGVVFDVVFNLPSQKEEDEAFADAIRASKIPVVLAATVETVKDPRFTRVDKVKALPMFLEAGGIVGFATLNLDRDGVLRRARLSVDGEPTMAVAIFQKTGGKLEDLAVPIASLDGEDPEVFVNFVGGARSTPTVSYYQALEYETALPKGIFAGKVVFVGQSLTIQDISEGKKEKDLYATPFDLLMPGVEIHGDALATLRRQNFIRMAGPGATWALLFLTAALVSLVVVSIDSFPLKIYLSLLLIVGTFGAACVAFVSFRYWIYTAQPIAVMLSVFVLNTLYQYRATERERAHIRRALTGYVSREVMTEVLKNPGALELGGIQVQATVLFSDIAGFSKISEGITPRELATMLNDYFSRMGDAIMGHGGMINKYIGDAIMAIWGAPLQVENHAERACLAALDMKRIVEGMGGPIRGRIGINTGPMVAGNLGHRERMEYTVIGDAVNLASRLEGANKAYSTSIMISDATEELVRGKVLARQVDWIRVVGKEQPVKVYELVARYDELNEKLAAMLRSFEEILQVYEVRDWERVCALIDAHLEVFPHDTVARAYAARCRKFRAAPPPEDWDGVYALEAK